MNPKGIGFDSSHMKYDYTQYSHDNDVNVIPDADYRRLVADTFETICDTMRKTYGPYGSSVIITEQNQTIATKDGYNTFEALHFSHNYKQQVYLSIQEIINRVNENVGDGTTSCILLADKMFNELKDVAKNADDERKIKKILELVETELQRPDAIESDKEEGLIHKLNEKTLFNMIKLAANYDENLTRNLVKAMDPQFDENGDLLYVRNVIVDEDRDTDNTTDVEYSYDYLPGDYRVNITIHPDLGREWIVPQQMRILVCDHAFTESDWMKLENGKLETDVPVLIVARAVTQKFFDETYTKRYALPLLASGSNLKYYFCEMKGGYIKNEIKDLCAVLGVKPMTFETVGPIDLEYMTKEYKISISNGNCLCFYDCEPATEYAETLKFEMQSDLEKSVIKKGIWEGRINACLLRDKDTLFKIKTGNRLQAKLIVDKITDCCSIIKSAVDNGVTPNLLSYGHLRMKRIYGMFDTDAEKVTLAADVCYRICKAIRGLFDDIWYSKYGDIENEDTRKANETGREICADNFYEGNDCKYSFDIVTEQLKSYEEFPTSSQYDIEVLVAGITIVKYMLTSKAFIFDSCLLQPHGDKGYMDPDAF
jgi:hypothetical protein